VITWLVATAGLLAGAAVAWVVSHGGPDRLGVPNLPLAVPVVVLVGWSFIGSGLLSPTGCSGPAGSSPPPHSAS